MRRETRSRSCCYLRVKLVVETDEPEEAERLRAVLKPDDVPVKGLNYESSVLGKELVYLFESDEPLKVRVAADEVLEHASLVEAIKGLSGPGEGVSNSVREEESGN